MMRRVARLAGLAGLLILLVIAHSTPVSATPKRHGKPQFRIGAGLARRNGGADGPVAGSIGAWGAAMGRIGEGTALGVEAGYYDLGRFAGTSTCLTPSCEEYSYSDYHRIRVIHAGLILDTAGNPGKRQAAFLGGVGLYYVMTSHERNPNIIRDEEQEGAGPGVTLGLAVPVARISPVALFEISARFHGMVVVQSEGVGSGGFLTLGAGVKSF